MCFFDKKMDSVERFEKDRHSNGSSVYKILTTNGFKRILFLILLISLLNIIYVVLYKLSEGNLNTIFERLNNKLKAEPFISNETLNKN